MSPAATIPAPARVAGRTLILAMLLAMPAAGLAEHVDGHDMLPSFRSRTTPVEAPTDLPSVRELEARGAVIGRVLIRAEDIFDPTRPDEDTALFRLANRLHIESREETIRERLLFASGDPLTARLLEESERLLRDTRFLYDARIRPIAYADGVVDLEVLTRDTWTLNPGVNYGRSGGVDTISIKLEERNVLGYGTQLVFEASSEIERDTNSLEYHDTNLGGRWLNLDLELEDNSDGNRQAINLERPFYALDSRWTAAVNANISDRVEPVFDRGVAVDEYGVRLRSYQVLRGFSNGLVEGRAHRWTFGYDYSESRYFRLPQTVDPARVPEDLRLAFPWLRYQYVEDAFYTTRNRDQIERTEDFSSGWDLSLRLGLSQKSWNSDLDALVVDTAARKGFRFDGNRSLTLNAGVEGRIEDGVMVDGLSSGLARYYQRQSPRRLFFASLGADDGIGLDPVDQLLLGGDNGLRGYPLRYVSGQGRWLLTLEQRFFTNWYPFRLFHVGGAIFFDAGGVWGSSLNAAPNPGTLRDVGFGLRLGNSRSALGNQLHVDFAFPLDGDDSIDSFQFLVESKASF